MADDTVENHSAKMSPLVVPVTGKVQGSTPSESIAATKLCR